jgi:hypothetical protein
MILHYKTTEVLTSYHLPSTGVRPSLQFIPFSCFFRFSSAPLNKGRRPQFCGKGRSLQLWLGPFFGSSLLDNYNGPVRIPTSTPRLING